MPGLPYTVQHENKGAMFFTRVSNKLRFVSPTPNYQVRLDQPKIRARLRRVMVFALRGTARPARQASRQHRAKPALRPGRRAAKTRAENGSDDGGAGDDGAYAKVVVSDLRFPVLVALVPRRSSLRSEARREAPSQGLLPVVLGEAR
jgi:hypothetical protein